MTWKLLTDRREKERERESKNKLWLWIIGILTILGLGLGIYFFTKNSNSATDNQPNKSPNNPNIQYLPSEEEVQTKINQNEFTFLPDNTG